MSLSGAAAAMGLPETLVQRSAEARAADTGASVEEILAAWAGGEAVEASSAGAEDVAVTGATAAEESTAPTEETPQPEPVAPAAVVVEPPSEPVLTPTRAPVPTEVTPGEAARLPEVITVPTAGIKERTNFVIPKWLTGLMVVVPLFALFALGGSSTGACGEATELATDVISGDIVNCDGSAFTGGGVGGGATNFLALGEDIFMGNGVAGVNCSSCHGANGQGGVGPALGGVLTTFGACPDHIEWVRLGSGGFPDGHGDTNKPTAGGMPAFGDALTDEQLASVATFERVHFGGGNLDEALAGCGLVEPDEGTGTGDGTSTTEGGDQGAGIETTTTLAG